jgi:hypothetical protein
MDTTRKSMEDGTNRICSVLQQLINTLIGFGGNMKGPKWVQQFWDLSGGAERTRRNGTELAVEGLKADLIVQAIHRALSSSVLPSRALQ